MNPSRATELLDAHFDKTATDDERVELEQLLLTSDDVRAQFWQAAELSFLVRTAVEASSRGGSRALAVIGDPKTAAGSGEVRDRGQENEPSANSPQPTASSPTPRSKKSWLDRASRRPVRPALAIAALVMISVVAWMGVTMVKTQIAGGGKSTDEQQKNKKPEFVAWLMKAHKTQWLDGTQPQKTKLMPGQRLVISKGLIEIQYRTRAVVVIEGPAEFWVGGIEAEGTKAQRKAARSSSSHPSFNSGYLALGSLVARVEGEKAKGFTIETPNARLEDQGTEFGVEVAQSGSVEMHVFAGKVKSRLKLSGGGYGKPVLLAADHAIQIAPGARRVEYITAARERFAAASSALRTRTISNLIDASANNGGFESGTDLAFSDTNDWTNFTGNQSINSRLSSHAHTGTYSGVVGNVHGNDYFNAVDTNLGGSGYTISVGDRYELSFWHIAASGWDDGDSYDWQLFYTSDNTIGGAVTVLFNSSVAPSGSFAMELITTEAVTDAGANRKNLWLRFVSNAGDNKLARVDDVVLSVISHPQGSSTR